MTDIEPLADQGRKIPFWLRGGLGLVVILLAGMWFIEIVDTVALDDRLEGNGIHPRNVDGLAGIAWAPFLHGGLGHLLSNTIPFAILSGLALTRGIRRYISASLLIIGIGGLLVWTFAIGSNENHIGASGWVFGLFGYVVAAALFEKRPLSILAALAAIVLYGGTIIFGSIPRPGISWEGHVFGFVAGVAAARLLTRRQHDPQELAEPT